MTEMTAVPFNIGVKVGVVGEEVVGDKVEKEAGVEAIKAEATLGPNSVRLEDRSKSMTPEDIRATITEMCRVQPSLLLHILDHCNGQPRPEGSFQGQPSWCSCYYFWEMPTEQERVCCNRTKRLRTATPGNRSRQQKKYSKLLHWRIRAKYPDVSGQYIGYIGGRLG
uniref:Uncharacterized protein LOC111102016 n=1 Tax=Crassostrea virginica TaxID=6565 RepID=A0A8B8AIK2_CRAVI|nr:uncharacterized protein LOC111102016 [Crassostrea virginica]